MMIRVQDVTTLPAAQWDDWVTRSPGGGHILQSHAWGECKRGLGWQPLRLVMYDDTQATLPDGASLIPLGTAQVLSFATPLWGHPLLYCPKGPWLDWHDAWHAAIMLGAIEEYARRIGAFALRLEPEIDAADSTARAYLRDCGARSGVWQLQYQSSWVIDLRPDAPDDALLADMKPKTRYNINLARRKGVRIDDETTTFPFSDFYALYQHTSQRDTFPIRPFTYVAGTWQAMRQAGHAHLFVARHNEEVLAALGAYVLGNKCWYMYGASRTEGRHLMPAPLLQWEVMRWARQRGATLYDMLAVPTPDNRQEGDPWWGLYRFKSGFGGRSLDTPGTLQISYNKTLSRLWRRLEPAYYRFHLLWHGDVYY